VKDEHEMAIRPDDDPLLDEDEWLDEEPRSRGGLPGWAKFCGCGCLLVIALFVTLAFVVGRQVSRGLDEEFQWQALESALPYDARPASITPVFGWEWATPFILLNDERGYMWIVRSQKDDGSLFLEEIFGQADGARDPILNFEHVGEDELGTVEVQGRELRVRRILQSSVPVLEALGGEGKGSGGQSILVDLTPEGSQGMLVVLIVAVDSEEPISDEQLRELLAPFRVGPEHAPYVDAPADEPAERPR
jgi:hypothetical protein